MCLQQTHPPWVSTAARGRQIGLHGGCSADTERGHTGGLTCSYLSPWQNISSSSSTSTTKLTAIKKFPGATVMTVVSPQSKHHGSSSLLSITKNGPTWMSAGVPWSRCLHRCLHGMLFTPLTSQPRQNNVIFPIIFRISIKTYSLLPYTLSSLYI